MKQIFKSAICIISAYLLILIPYWIYFIRSVSYDPLLEMPMDNVEAFYPTYSSFIWSAFVGVFFYCLLHGQKNAQYEHNGGRNRKKFLLQTLAGIVGLVVIGCVTDRYYGRLDIICGEFYYAISNTKHCLETGTVEQFNHITIISEYFDRTIIPDFLKMMNLLVVFLFHQGMRLLSAVRINNAAAVMDSGK